MFIETSSAVRLSFIATVNSSFATYVRVRLEKTLLLCVPWSLRVCPYRDVFYW